MLKLYQDGTMLRHRYSYVSVANPDPAGGYKMRYCTLQLGLTSGSRFATDRGNDVSTTSLPSLHLQQSLRHDMANAGFYRTELHVLSVMLTLKAEKAPADTHHKR
jgi:hypothetical protein